MKTTGLFLEMKKAKSDPILQTWINLNNFLRDADEKQCQRLLQVERNGRARQQFLKRIHSRLNKVRADRERLELEEKS